MTDPEPKSSALDFSNTSIAFSKKTDKQLKQSAMLFRMMNNPFLTGIGTSLALLAIKLRIPFTNTIIRKTIFRQFCGGENLLDCQDAIDNLYEHNALTILDYGAESKSSEEELDFVMEETIRAIELAASNNSVPVVSTKITGLGDNDLLIKIDAGKTLSEKEKEDYDKLLARVDKICAQAHELGVGVFVDAEESWMQEAIDAIVYTMMEKYNKKNVIVFNTYQLYRHDKLAQMKADYKQAISKDYMLGAKIVRGAYMEKERARATEQNYPSPIHMDKPSVDKDFDEAVQFCVENYRNMGSCCATHNVKSNMLQARLIDEHNIPKDHPHLNFCQLYGMSDNITFNIAHAGYNVAKYVPYGPIRDVIPYLIRRAKENTSVTGEMSRELQLISKELKRRDLE